MLWLYVLIGIAVIVGAAALFDRTAAGKRVRAQGGINLDHSRPAAKGGPGYSPPTDGGGSTGM